VKDGRKCTLDTDTKKKETTGEKKKGQEKTGLPGGEG